TVLNFSNLYSEGVPNLYLRLLTFSHSFVRLLGLIFFPLPIHIEKGIPYAKSFLEPETLLSVTALALFGMLIFHLRRKNQAAAFGFLWFSLCLLPMANIVPINTTLADHWLYLPGPGFFLGIIGLVWDGIKKVPPNPQNLLKKCSLGVYLVIICLFSLLTMKQNTVWKDPILFYQAVLKYNPNSFRAWNELGVLYLNADRLEEASYHFEKAVALNTEFDQAYDNLGTAYDKSGKPEEAIKAHKKALEINPDNPKIYNNLGNAYNNLNRLDEALEMYRKALRLNPAYKAVYNNVGVVYYKKGMLNEAIKYWTKALEIDPNFDSAANNIKTARETLSK
ncbi:MAG: tetratricopeptide repeat protein, partial [Candidatus Omnitrophota bacterium]